MRLLNLGCGSLYCSVPCWTNVDFVARGEGVMKHDLLLGVPFDAETFDAVYHSNVLEHFTEEQGVFLMKECFRVLKPGGMIRVVVPDLENICQAFLDALSRLSSSDETCLVQYKWLKMELFDQITRTRPGGEMEGFLRGCSERDLEYVIERVGRDARLLAGGDGNDGKPELHADYRCSPWWWKLKIKKLHGAIRARLINAVLRPDEKMALKAGLFRMSGEIHQCMYDRYSLKKLMQNSGLRNCCERSPSQSSIPNWASYHLDIDVHAQINAPTALFMEGMKT
jgi:SAM-dependent methyltransferase